MILSASGWRGVFSLDGNEESRLPEISEAHKLICANAARVFAEFIRNKTNSQNIHIVVAMDTRPTGKAVSRVILSALQDSGCTVRWTGICSAPEIMAYARKLGKDPSTKGGFIFISASHNPIGHNGLKFGMLDGSVLKPEDAMELTALFKESFSKREAAPPSVCAMPESEKTNAFEAYLSFIENVIAGDGINAEQMRQKLRAAVRQKPIGIVCDFNGSARSASIDSVFFESYGIAFKSINDNPGEIVHRIVPEGDALEPCRLFLEESHKKNDAFVLGYVPDCDGDRGNLVVWDENLKKARALESQEVFALACVSELSHIAWTGLTDTGGLKIALAVNDATSMRVDRIAEAFNAKVFRAETGEANVVSLARKLRAEGWTVRILGEGAAGGNITHPSAVRDPLCSVMGLVKLITLPGFRREFSMPRFVTTEAYSAKAKLRVLAEDHGALKREYQRIFLEQWDMEKQKLAARGIKSFHAFRYNGITELSCDDDFGSAGRGGLKINFYNEDGRGIAAIWMRGSATEPVFRVMADVEGDDAEFERVLIEWQRGMVLAADALCN
jgi:phosphoglucomutase